MSVRVIARVRPLQKSEFDKDVVLQTSCANEESRPSIVRIPNPRNEAESFSFQFNSVYDSGATQQDIFDGEVAPTIKHLFNGLDVTIFAYGVTGTGKTHTMRGGKTLADRGVIPRLLSGIYRRGRKIEKDSEVNSRVQVSMSYYEIYNDKVFDLFEAPEKRTLAGLPLRDAGGKTIVAGLTERPCETLKDFERLYDLANANRSTGATKLNAHSSRSHAILCVKVSITTGDHTRTSTASAIDLAGSEDNRRTENSKERLVESSSINKSLFVLAQCVEAISKKASRIPYRESKMTRILSLGQNNGLTIMILNLASVRSFHLDTLTSLNFANRTKKVEIRDIENEAIFMGCARPVAVSKTMQRQPLRALTSATHNANVGKASNLASNASTKPKLFSVYSDPVRKSLEAQKVLKERRASAKRPSDSHSLDHRPAKIPRPSSFVSTKSQAKITQEAIEDMVERKVSEILATRALEQKVTPQPQIGEDVKRRLEALEQRIEEHDDDERAEGLSFLLMAKQHRARGEDASALKMYRMAREHFPGNPKLEAKISRLQSKLQENMDGEAAATEFPLSREPLDSRRVSKFADEDTDYAPDPADELYDSEAGTRYRTKIRRSHRSAPAMWIDSSAPPTPRTARLLAVINSRDIGAIQALKGVGAKKAETIVAALHVDHGQELEDGEGGLSVESLLELGAIRGVGPRLVESMRMGLTA